jgi:hypothetical protein
MRYFLSSVLLCLITLLVACGKNPDATRDVSGRRPSATAIAVQSSAPQTSSTAPTEQETTESTSAPPSTLKDEGACPFEGCIYRQWKTEEATAIHEQPDNESPVVFPLKPGEWVTAITGFVLTSEPGIFEFTDDGKTPQEFKFSRGAKVYVYTYYGEGAWKAWFNGHFFTFDESSEEEGKFVKKPKSSWWVRIKNSENREGWTFETGHFSNMDQLGGPDLSPSATVSR